MTSTPNPGSKEAIVKGCRCPIIDNHYGKGMPIAGYDETQFWISSDCPMHGPGAGERTDV